MEKEAKKQKVIMKKTKKIKPDKLDLRSMSVIEDQKRKLRQLFPEVFNEGKIDWKKLKASLGEHLDNGPERYDSVWPGKARCFRIIQEPSLGALKPCKKESLEWDKTQNLFIEGDNLEVLKLLQKAYYGRVKMIYIDPPYNTGKDFIYPDKYSESLETYLRYTGQKDSKGKKFSTNQETDGRFHSNWLNMMYPRLFLARNLLRDDGVIFISIDDNEAANLRKICDDIFGEENFIGTFIINSTPNGRDYGHIAKTHEFCLFYSKDVERCKTNFLPAEREFKYYDEKGGFNIHPLYNSNEAFHKANRPNLYYPFFLYKDRPIRKLEGNFYEIGLEKRLSSIEIFPPLSQKNKIQFVWRWNKEKSLKNLNQEIIGYRTSENNYRIVQKMRTDKKVIRSILSDRGFTSRRGTAEAEQLLAGKIFQFPKPVSLIKNFLHAGMDRNSIILDFFAGSATTAHAVYEKNLEDGGSRRYICVQLPEPIEEGTEAHKAGFKTIADIGKERIRRAIRQIKEKARETSSSFRRGRKNKAALDGRQAALFHEGEEGLSRGNKAAERGETAEISEKSADPQNVRLQNGRREREQSLLENNVNNGGKNTSGMDWGFRVFKLDKSNFRIWDEQASKDQNPSEQIAMNIEEFIDPKSSEEDLLYEILIKTGFQLTTPIKVLSLSGKKVYSVENHALLICLERKITKELIQEMAILKPARVVCLDKGFENNDWLKTSAKETFDSFGARDFRVI